MECYQPHLPLLLYVVHLPLQLPTHNPIDRGFKAQGMDRKERLHYRSPLQASILYSDVNREFVIPSLNHQPGLAVWGLTWCTTIVLINGFEVFWNFTASGFLTGCAYQPLHSSFST